MSETAAAPPKDAESYLLEGEEDETEVRFSFAVESFELPKPWALVALANAGDQADEAASGRDGTRGRKVT
jgi:hypothetical protein